jgi:hypothetical protein
VTFAARKKPSTGSLIETDSLPRMPTWATALAHEFGYLERHDKTDTAHAHRVLYRLGVWRVRQWRREARNHP